MKTAFKTIIATILATTLGAASLANAAVVQMRLAGNNVISTAFPHPEIDRPGGNMLDAERTNTNHVVKDTAQGHGNFDAQDDIGRVVAGNKTLYFYPSEGRIYAKLKYLEKEKRVQPQPYNNGTLYHYRMGDRDVPGYIYEKMIIWGQLPAGYDDVVPQELRIDKTLAQKPK